MKFSLIIPVYNAENTLRRCIDSIVDQPFSDYELILVNDGSSDSSLEICEEYAQNYKNIKVVNKKNGGAASARNTGLDNARGDFILFADSDDYVEKNYFDEISVSKCPEGLTVFTYFVKNRKGENIKKVSESLLNDESDLFEKSKLLVLTRLINVPFSKIFDRKYIEKNHLRFDERMPVAEDFNFCLAYLMKCEKVVVKNIPIYTYDATNDDSLVRKRKEGLIDIYPTVFNVAYETISHSKFTEEQKYELYRVWDKLHTDSFGTCVMEEFKDKSKSANEVKKEIKKMCKKFYSEYSVTYGYQNMIHRAVRTCIKYKLSGTLYVLGKLYVKMRDRGLV